MEILRLLTRPSSLLGVPPKCKGGGKRQSGSGKPNFGHVFTANYGCVASGMLDHCEGWPELVDLILGRLVWSGRQIIDPAIPDARTGLTVQSRLGTELGRRVVRGNWVKMNIPGRETKADYG
ncbi:MAG: hypothetical protein ACHQFZ_04575 [Acidimicrobiales bacterium]